MKKTMKTGLIGTGPGRSGAKGSGKMRKRGHGLRDIFPACALEDSLLEKMHLAAKSALPGDVILFSPACSSLDHFRENQGVEKVSRRAAKALAPTTNCRNARADHNMQAVAKRRQTVTGGDKKYLQLTPGFFEEKPRRKITNKTHLTMKGR